MSGGFRRRSRSGIAIAAAGALIVLLGVLATLQYRWIGEVSSAERDRLRASARASADDVAAGFDADITRVFHHFGVPPHESDPGSAIAASGRIWAGVVPSPDIVAEVFVVRRGDAPSRFLLARIDLATGRTDPVDWPASLEPVRSHLERVSPLPIEPGGGRGGPFSADGGRPPVFLRRPGAEIFDEIPALLIPKARSPRLRAGGETAPESGDVPAWVIVRFDRVALVDGLLARLVRREFGSSGDLDVAVVRRAEPHEVVFRSRPGFAPARAPSRDAEAALFSIRPGGPPPGDLPHGERRMRPEREPSGEAGPAGVPAWTLVVAHRSGSLQEAVDATRRRNLAVSAGILFLLAAVVAILVLTAHRAQRLARQQVEFVAGITHELRTPLAAIRSAGQNLADGVVADPERVRRYGSLVEREGRRLSGLIEQALAYAGIAARRETVPFCAVALSRVIEEAVAACRPLAEENGAAIEREFPADLPNVSGDPSALRTLFENLVSNAVKYGGRGGVVAIRAHAKGSTIEVSVTDSGPGISPGDLSHVFEPFYRGADVASGTISGSGLGLSLVRRIAETHGGSVEVESSPERGAIFRVTIPAMAPSPEPRDASAPSAVGVS